MKKLAPIGFGCSPLRPGGRRLEAAAVEAAVAAALAAGYRLFDLAELYGTEAAVGRVLRRPGAPPRGELCLVGKVWRTNFRPEHLVRACESSLRRLGVDAFDLYLLHAPEAWRHLGPLPDPEVAGWPELERLALPLDPAGAPELDAVPLAETWEAMRELERRGVIGAAGVSNFGPDQFDLLGGAAPAANQIASTPYRPDDAAVAYCRGRGIALMAHSPLSAPGLLAEPLLVRLAVAKSCSPAAVALRWHLQRGLTPLPASSDPAHLVGNLRCLEIELSTAEMAAIELLAARG